ncbi:hypothetical protein [Ulvibacter antarcticus]|uniref:Uncharacterized protein n=1 Tax=Ulvibacter antarcticus TaxID=442714 RepID=A0A3L9Y9J8_9FLAO|nr:hypothetical protein [Ulvibacter antarcticus]RMA57044.1 hypothetical protein BXY75_2925 [Ulvibacter antarcticus]
MKTKHTSLLILIVLLFLPFAQFAQVTESQAYWVHEDPVYPAKVLDYEALSSTLAANCRKYDIKKANWITISTDDLRYFTLSPIKNMADLDKSRFSVLQSKMGEKEFNALFENFDECYDTHIDYIIHLDNDLSYMPGGVVQVQEGMEFRKLEMWYTTPQNFPKVLELAKQFKALYEKKNSKEYYRLYRSGFGSPGQFILLAISAKSAEDYERIRKENKELLGEARTPIYEELLRSIIRVETLNGYMRQDLSFTPKE